jgi:hypothetical protein
VRDVIDEDAQADRAEHRLGARLVSAAQAVGPNVRRPALPFPTRSRRPSVSLQAEPLPLGLPGSVTFGCNIVERNGRETIRADPRRLAARVIRRVGRLRGALFRVGSERPRSVCPAASKRPVGRAAMRALGRSELRRSRRSSARRRGAASSLDGSLASREKRPLPTDRQQSPGPQPGRAHGHAAEGLAAARPGSARRGRQRPRRPVAGRATGAHWPRNRTRGSHRRSSRRRRRVSGIGEVGGLPSRVHGGAMQPAPALGRRRHSDTPGRQPHCRQRRDDRARAETGGDDQGVSVYLSKGERNA